MRVWRRPIWLGGILAGVLAGAVVAQNAAHDPVLRITPLAGFPISVAGDEATGSALVVPFAASTLQVVDLAGGASPRTIRLAPTGALANWVVIDRSSRRAFVGGCCLVNGAGTISVLDAGSGALLSTVGTSGYQMAVAVSERMRRVFAVGGNSLSMLDATSGALLHTSAVGRNLAAVAVSEGSGRVFVVDSANEMDTVTVSALNGRTGALLRTVAVGGAPWLPVPGQTIVAAAVSESAGHLFVADNGVVSMLDAHNGTLLRTLNAGVTMGGGCSSVLESESIAVDDTRSLVYVLGSRIDRGQVSVLDARTGALLGSRTISMGLGGMAVNPRTGHLLLAVQGRLDHACHVTGPGSVLALGGTALVERHSVGVGQGPAAVVASGGIALVLNSGLNPDRTPVGGGITAGWWSQWRTKMPSWLGFGPSAALPLTSSLMALDPAQL